MVVGTPPITADHRLNRDHAPAIAGLTGRIMQFCREHLWHGYEQKRGWATPDEAIAGEAALEQASVTGHRYALYSASSRS